MISLVLPFPPTANTYWRSVPVKRKNGQWAAQVRISKRGREYRRIVINSIMTQCKHACVNLGASFPVSVEIEAHMPDLRRRDLDNLNKSLLDAITHSGLWRDDSQVDDLRIRRFKTGKNCVVVHVREIENATD